MTLRGASCGGATGAAVAALLVGSSLDALAAPVLRSAEINITIVSPTACDVAMTLTIDAEISLQAGDGVPGNASGAPPQETAPIDHRIEAFDGSRVELIEARGARQAGDLRTIGRTRSLVLHVGRSPYELRYRVRQPDDRRGRCPIWLPAVPTDGRSRAVRLEVTLPTGTRPGSSMPALAWTSTRGVATLGHVPSFVRLSFAPVDASLGWDVAAVMDAAAVAVVAAASGVWVWRRRRR
jgi:hypothetical protein